MILRSQWCMNGQFQGLRAKNQSLAGNFVSKVGKFGKKFKKLFRSIVALISLQQWIPLNEQITLESKFVEIGQKMAELRPNLSCVSQFWAKIFLVFDLNDGFIMSNFHFLHAIMSSKQIYTRHPNFKSNGQKSDLLRQFMFTKNGKIQQKSHVTVLYLVTFGPKMHKFENKFVHNCMNF